MVCDGELAGEDLFACVLEVLRREHSHAPWSSRSSTSPSSWPSAGRPATASPSASGSSPTSRPTFADDPDLTTPGPADPGRRCVLRGAPGPPRRARPPPTSTWPGGWPRGAPRIGQYDEATVEALLERDPDPDAAIRALAVRTARPHAEAKDEAWSELFEKKNVPGGPMLGALIRAFWQPEQDDLLLPYADRFLDEVPALAGGGMLMVFGLMFGMFPQVADEAFRRAGRRAWPRTPTATRRSGPRS